jgi:hypothetical protein
MPSDDTTAKDAGAAAVYSLDEDFYLDATPKVGREFRDLELRMGETLPGNLIGLALMGFDGTPTFAFLAIAPADGIGSLAIGGQVPPGAGGHEADFQAFAIGLTGKIVASNLEHVELL